ncbi:MAG: maleylacetate reductase [Pseudoclavibacter sp.]
MDRAQALVFDHLTPRQRLRFGEGIAAVALADEAAERGAERIMVIAGGSSAAAAAEITRDLAGVALRWDDLAPHVPIEKARAAREAAREHRIDLVVSIGGGSTVGLAKAIAMTERLPIVAIPTTYAGSEATSVWGITERGRKTTGVDEAVLPVTVIADPALSRGLPIRLSVASGLNGIAHCVDALWAPNADPINAAPADVGMHALAGGLARFVDDPTHESGRDEALLGSYLAAVAFASSGSGMHHKICHALGGTYNLPHAETHAIVLPFVVAFNAPMAPDAAGRIARALGGEAVTGARGAGARAGVDAARAATSALSALRDRLGAPMALHDLGFRDEDIPEAASIILPSIPPSNPRAVDRVAIERLLRLAASGGDPAALID